MALFKGEGIVLRTRNLGEADKILIIYTREHGKLSASARGARRSRSRLLAPSQLFAHSRYLFFKGRSLHSVSQAELVHSFRPLREDISRLAYASYLAELLDVFISDAEPNAELFRNVLEGFTLMAGADDLELASRWFEMNLLTHLGYRPQLHHCVSCEKVADRASAFSPIQGGVLCSVCARNDRSTMPVTPSVVAQLRYLQQIPATKWRSFQPSATDRNIIQKLMDAHIEHRLDRPLKSRAFLDTLKSMDANASTYKQ